MAGSSRDGVLRVKSLIKTLILRVATHVPAFGRLASRLGLLGVIKSALGIAPAPAAKIWSLISVSPHNLKLYEYFLAARLAEGFSFVTSRQLYGGEPLDPSNRYILVRHDVDYAPERLRPIVEIERRLGVRSDIDVVISGRHYDPTPYVAEWRSLADDGFAIGLHTVAPQEDDCFSIVRSEIEIFQKALGFSPRTFSIHGACPTPPNWQQRRNQFIERVGKRLESFGFSGSHNIGGVTFWVEDSGRGGEFAYLCQDFVERVPQPGQVMGVLVHPDHWLEWPIGWTYDPEQQKEHPEILDLVNSARR